MPNSLVRQRSLPWIGMGTSGNWTNPMDALEEAGLSFEVEPRDAFTSDDNKIPGVIANCRKDNGEILGVVTPRYGIVQNKDAFSMLEPFCRIGGVIEHAGMTQQGMVFMVMRIQGGTVRFSGDEFELYVCAMNSFNAAFPLALIITPVRVVCQNMFRKLMKSNNDVVTLIKHGRFAADRILSVNAASTTLIRYQDDLMETLTEFNSEAIFRYEVVEFSEKMLPHVPEDKDHPRANITNARIDESREEFVNQYYYAPDNIKYTGTKLGLINAYYDWITHRSPQRATGTFEDVRFGNLLNGTAVNTKLLRGI